MSPDAQTLSTTQMDTLASVLDTLIPASDDGHLPAAGTLGLATPLWEKMSASPELVPFYAGALDTALAAAQSRGGDGLDSLTLAERSEILNETETAHPGVIGALVFHAYVAYYQHPDVMPGLGLEPRPPHPVGYEIVENDLGLLDAVRSREKLYREA